jgi:hypothetical protein
MFLTIQALNYPRLSKVPDIFKFRKIQGSAYTAKLLLPDGLANGGVNCPSQASVAGHGNEQLLGLLLLSNLKILYSATTKVYTNRSPTKYRHLSENITN